MFCSHSVFNFCEDVRKTAIISLFRITWLVYFTDFHFLKSRGHYMYRQIIISTSTFCPLIVFLGNVWIWVQTAFISLHNFKWLVYITEISPSNDQLSLYIHKSFHSTFLRSSHTLNLCVLYESENKRQILPYWTLTGLYNRHFTI